MSTGKNRGVAVSAAGSIRFVGRGVSRDIQRVPHPSFLRVRIFCFTP